ncbi:mucin-2-like [Sitophilus oryzae]|uniref:Mucin-2-like n=1 Tax=Sitophilus oryzae TaxID=7048 RepID=A0A6J2YIE1_SITOR|nr:mucin-2-like [Sitophilus oryzae]
MFTRSMRSGRLDKSFESSNIQVNNLEKLICINQIPSNIYLKNDEINLQQLEQQLKAPEIRKYQKLLPSPQPQSRAFSTYARDPSSITPKTYSLNVNTTPPTTSRTYSLFTRTAPSTSTKSYPANVQTTPSRTATNYSSNAQSTSSSVFKASSSNTPSTSSRTATPSTSSRTANESKAARIVRRFGETEAEKTFILTGTVERVIKWGKIFQNHFCYFEVIAAVISLTPGKFLLEKTMLLRDRKGPILQVSYFSTATHINIEDFHLGQFLRVMGRMTGANIMAAHTIRAASTPEIESLPRMCYICDHAVNSFCGEVLPLV